MGDGGIRRPWSYIVYCCITLVKRIKWEKMQLTQKGIRTSLRHRTTKFRASATSRPSSLDRTLEPRFSSVVNTRRLCSCRVLPGRKVREEISVRLGVGSGKEDNLDRIAFDVIRMKKLPRRDRISFRYLSAWTVDQSFRWTNVSHNLVAK